MGTSLCSAGSSDSEIDWQSNCVLPEHAAAPVISMTGSDLSLGGGAGPSCWADH